MRRREGFWQSFADLAMGVMAVIMLILLLVLQKQARNEAQFREELRRALVRGKQIVQAQDELAQLIQALFRESNCPLNFDPATGRLLAGSGSEGAELYPEGSVRLSENGRAALRQCGINFLTLVVCFDDRPAALQSCRGLLEKLEDPGEEGEAAGRFESFADLRGKVESMILEGNTDRSRFLAAPSIRNLRPRDFPSAESIELHEKYVTNAHLGSERARQALGHLVQVIASTAASETMISEGDALDALLHLLSIESPSFGKYLAGPVDRRLGSCAPDNDDCPEARNLALRLRWRQQSLREPFDRIVRFYCEQLERERLRGAYNTVEGDIVICGGRSPDANP